MEFQANAWIGSWSNFEHDLFSTEPELLRCWQDAEAALGPAIPAFRNGVKNFWIKVCDTVKGGNAVRLDGWNVTEKNGGLEIEWRGEHQTNLGTFHYEFQRTVSNGLEGTDNFLFVSTDAPQNSPFSCLLAMEPMPERHAKANGGLLSHLHFQFSATEAGIFQGGTLVNPLWYPTMCAADGTLLDRCNIVRALHKLPRWAELPIV